MAFSKKKKVGAMPNLQSAKVPPKMMAANKTGKTKTKKKKY